MDGTRNMGGAAVQRGKVCKKTIECIVADAGARSQGAMAGTAISCWSLPSQRSLASLTLDGWQVVGHFLGQQAGETIGSQVGSVFNDC